MLELDRQIVVASGGASKSRFLYKCKCGYERLYCKKAPSGVKRKCPTCDAHTMVCEVCGGTFYKPDNASIVNFRKRKTCNNKCKGIYAQSLKEGGEIDRSILSRDENIEKIKIAKYDIQNKKDDRDSLECCANCGLFDKVGCPTKTIVFLSETFDVFKFSCEKFNKTGE